MSECSTHPTQFEAADGLSLSPPPAFPAPTPVPNRPKVSAEDVLAHIPALRVYARSLCRDVTLADDLVQEALLRAINAIGQFKPGTNLRAWLFTILRNGFYTQYSRRRREAPGSEEDVAELSASVADQQLWSITCKETERALARMPVHYSEALIMVAVLGSSYQETADVLCCDIGTVKSRVNRARARLRAELGDIFNR